MPTLYIGNKNYSSWSMRPWVLMRQAGIAFDEVMVPFDVPGQPPAFKAAIGRVSPVGQVPVLVDGELAVWDSLAIAEYLAERHPERQLWPADVAARARARSVCAEMHAGFMALRRHCSMNIEARLPEAGERLWREHEALRADVQRISAMWTELLERHGGGMLFGAFSIADAFFAPVCTRIRTYALPVPPEVAGYVDRVLALPGVRAWIDDALAEGIFLADHEDYRSSRD